MTTPADILDVIEGRARWCVVQGDALAVLAQLPAGCVDAVVTDPPYGIAYQSNWSERGPRFDVLANDDGPSVSWIGTAAGAVSAKGCMAVFCEWRHQSAFRDALTASGLQVRSQAVWDRCHHGMGDLSGGFAPCHDLIWFATKTGFAFHAHRPKSVLRFERVAATDLVHPTQKPVPLIKELVRALVPPGGIVLDPFAGSGTTGVAAILEGRRAILVELTENYAEIARARCAAAEIGADWRNPKQGVLFPRGTLVDP